jgi:hypothetical protein
VRRPSPRGLPVALPVLSLATAALAQPQSATLRGRIEYADTGLPVRHASVTFLKPELQWERPSAITDRSGEFAVKVQGYRIRSITLHGAALPRPFEVADGDDVTGIEIVLAPE